MNVKAKLDAARAELLDLGLRNPLINYKLLKARGVRLSMNPHQILVQDGKAMSFLPKAESEDDDNLLFNDDEAEMTPSVHRKLQTDISVPN